VARDERRGRGKDVQEGGNYSSVLTAPPWAKPSVGEGNVNAGAERFYIRLRRASGSR